MVEQATWCTIYDILFDDYVQYNDIISRILCVGNILIVLYGLVRHPTILACASPNACDCLHIESIKTFMRFRARELLYSAKYYDVPR